MTRALSLLSLSLLSACFHLGPQRLEEDQIGYSRSLGDGEKRQTLLNVVRLRYGDTPTFLDATQVIAGYQLQRSYTAGFEVFPRADPSTFVNGSGSVQLQESPTFTFQPVTGEQFAKTFMRPLPPSELLPFISGGLPVDVLFRLSVQSVNALANATSFTRDASGGSPGFFLLLRDLRMLQIAGLLGMRLELEKAEGEKADDKVGHVFLLVLPTTDPASIAVEDEAKRLLGMRAGSVEAEVVYGQEAGPGRIALLTRSMLSVLNQIGSQAEVPASDVSAGLTLPTVGDVGIERRPAVIVHADRSRPRDPYVAVPYHGLWFWIANEDFDSKLAFTTVQILLALATTSTGPGTVVTIPTG